MNLEGKYIEIDKNIAERVIRFLYCKGYNWGFYKQELEYTIDNYMEYFNVNEKSFIEFYGDNIFVFRGPQPRDRNNFINIILYMRKNKLNRILK